MSTVTPKLSSSSLHREMKGREKAGKTENISVCVRVRPLNSKEKKKCREAWQVDGNTLVQVLPNGKPLPTSAYTFDHVYTPEMPTATIFDTMAKV